MAKNKTLIFNLTHDCIIMVLSRQMPLAKYLFACEWPTMAKNKTLIFNLTHDCIIMVL